MAELRRVSTKILVLLLQALLFPCCRVASSKFRIWHRPNPFGLVPKVSPTNPFLTKAHMILVLRGGSVGDEDNNNDDDDQYDDYEDDDELSLDHQKTVDRTTKRNEDYDHNLIHLPPEESAVPPRSQRNRRQGDPPPPLSQRQPIRKKKKQPHWSQRLATQSLQMTGQLAWNTLVKQPSKLAYHIIRPKFVDIRETNGLWRLEQQVTERGDQVVASVATIELQSRPRLVILRKQETSPPPSNKDDKSGAKQTATSSSSTITVIKEPYTFTKKKLTGSYQTQFVVPAFLIGENQMRLYGYRGTWQRKLADRRVIKLVGKIYQVYRQRFGKNRGQYVFGQVVGTFVARRRIRVLLDEQGEDYDEEDEDNDEGWEEVDEEWDEDGYEETEEEL